MTDSRMGPSRGSSSIARFGVSQSPTGPHFPGPPLQRGTPLRPTIPRHICCQVEQGEVANVLGPAYGLMGFGQPGSRPVKASQFTREADGVLFY